ncbi:unnamed protein product [Rotaria sp. Silwood2]|nr:unnamed protein product [Rotaria sp. Silwood2]CAF3244188.1 unnamed protein product [Rotaria sp. Silwood2]CAF4292778.1 unnamed protein product [Rotaria sp. Silwood2]CAF4371091.1 unnamed protein product [Rotaria sp. Silwood2]
MRYTHRDVQRVFQVPFGSWLIPTIDSLLCILLMIGQIIYFFYGFWHSERRKLMKSNAVVNTVELLPTEANATQQNAQDEFESDLGSVNTKSAA